MTAYELAKTFCRLYRIQLVTTNAPSYYNPDKYLLNLNLKQSTSNEITDLATAAHECGHVIQQHNGEFFFCLWKALDKWVIPSMLICLVCLVLALIFSAIWIIPCLLCSSVIFLHRWAVIENERSASAHAIEILRHAGVPKEFIVIANGFLHECLKEYYPIKRAIFS